LKQPLRNLVEMDAILCHLPILEGPRGAYHEKSGEGWPVYSPEVSVIFKSVTRVAIRLDDYQDPNLQRMIPGELADESADID
jgi:hypothetical protein